MRGVETTIDDVARAAGVSRSTVSRVFNHRPGVSRSCRQRVHRAAEALRYRPNQSARALALGRASAVDLIAVSLSPDQPLGMHPYYSRALAGTVTALQRESIQLHVQVIAEDIAAERIDALAEEATMGAILVNVAPDLALRFYGRCSRVVSLIPTAAKVPAVEADNAGGARNAVTYLHGLGRRRIAAIHGPLLDTRAIGRRAGYRRATEILALSDISAEGGFTREGGYLAAVRLLDEHPDIDAIFAACDLTAAGAVQAIIATGRRVPHDISVVGFEDSLVAVCNSPTLTTMRQPIEDMATAAIRMLLTGGFGAGHREYFPVDLVQRDSTIRCSNRRIPAMAGKAPHTPVGPDYAFDRMPFGDLTSNRAP